MLKPVKPQVDGSSPDQIELEMLRTWDQHQQDALGLSQEQNKARAQLKEDQTAVLKEMEEDYIAAGGDPDELHSILRAELA